MAVVYRAVFRYEKEKDELSLTRISPDGSQDTSPVDLEDIRRMEKECRDSPWNQSLELSQKIGKELFDLLNGDRQTMVRALEGADDHGERLQVYVRPEGPASNLPFELLCHSDFLVPSRVHLVRHVSDWGRKRTLEPTNRPLKVLFMACSPEGISPVLDFEKEEDTIYEVTKELPVDIDVEDTGSLDGLAECLVQNRYDVVHLSGHADIDGGGVPSFLMEDEDGFPMWVTPSQLFEKLKLNLPRLVFLSGCRTGETSSHAAVSFAHHLVANHSSTVLGWGLPVSDRGASFAAKQLYFELSRGEDIPNAVLSTRRELFEHHKSDWSLLRLFSDGTPMTIPLVQKGQKKRPKLRDLQYTYLHSSKVKVLKKGFVGRRRQIQKGLRCLKKDEEKVGLLLHGTGGLGKSCLAGKFCERFKEHTLIIINGRLNTVTLNEALKDGFVRGRDEEGLKTLEEAKEMPDKLRSLCSSSFKERPYLILLDDFEKNLVGIKDGQPEVSSEAAPILETLLKYLPYSGKMSPLIVTCRYTFPFTVEGSNLVEQRLESIGLTSFRGSDRSKKVSELDQIAVYPDPEIRQQLIEAGQGNPRLMEALNTLLKESKDLDVVSLLSAVKGKQEEFVQNLVLTQILESQSEGFQRFMQRSAVYRLPVPKEGIRVVCEGLEDWESYIDRAVRLSLMEGDSTRRGGVLYWVTPLLGEDIFEELERGEEKRCHQAVVSYYHGVLSKVPKASDYSPIIASELIEHALRGGMIEAAIEEGGRLLPYLRNSLAYKEALSHGESILLQISKPERGEKLAKFLFELGWIYHALGEPKKAIKYYEQALSIDKEVYGDRHPRVATTLNNMGSAWDALGEPKKAIKYYEQALSIDKEVYGDRHPDVATTLNNMGLAWNALGEPKKAIKYYEQALSIVREAYGEKHPHVAGVINNLGGAWDALGEPKKAIKYFEQALSIDKEVYGDRHPSVATRLNNIGMVWDALGEPKKAIKYFEQALSIVREVYGEKHPHVATTLNNLGSAWDAIGDPKAIEYYEQALSIDKEVYGDRHPAVARDLNNLGGVWHALGEPKKAIGYFQEAYDIFREFYGDEHPHTRDTKEWLNILKK